MTDYPDEIHADECRGRDLREWEVTISYTIRVTVEADKDAEDSVLLDLADEYARRNYDFRDADSYELVESEVVG